MLDLGSIVGDYSAAKKIKDNNGYALLQIYNYFLLQENVSDEFLPDKKLFFALSENSVDVPTESSKKIESLIDSFKNEDSFPFSVIRKSLSLALVMAT